LSFPPSQIVPPPHFSFKISSMREFASVTFVFDSLSGGPSTFTCLRSFYASCKRAHLACLPSARFAVSSLAHVRFLASVRLSSPPPTLYRFCLDHLFLVSCGWTVFLVLCGTAIPSPFFPCHSIFSHLFPFFCVICDPVQRWVFCELLSCSKPAPETPPSFFPDHLDLPPFLSADRALSYVVIFARLLLGSPPRRPSP